MKDFACFPSSLSHGFVKQNVCGGICGELTKYFQWLSSIANMWQKVIKTVF